MLREKLIETIGKKKNKEIQGWYQGKVLEFTGFLLPKVKEEITLLKSNEFFESDELEVVVK